ncbi:MAG: hydrogenase maturation protease [Candidatus Eremiobacterota bacterium]
MKPAVIGLGNPDRGDDGVGPEVARRVRPETADVLVARGEVTELMDLWEGRPKVFVVDAVRSGSPPGTLHRLEAHREPLPAFVRQTSTHGFGLAEAVELARILGTLPEELVLYGIEAERMEAGAGLSPRVRRAVGQVVQRLEEELA